VPIATQFIELIQKNGESMETITQPKVDHTPAVLDDASKVLLRAAELLEQRGHCKGAAVSDGAYCLSGAISIAALDNKRFGSWGLWHGHDAAMKRVRKALQDPIAWNDAPERTADEVVAKLRAVALRGE
jgi:hypothetical protein